jgi:hypothetical protein
MAKSGMMIPLPSHALAKNNPSIPGGAVIANVRIDIIDSNKWTSSPTVTKVKIFVLIAPSLAPSFYTFPDDRKITLPPYNYGGGNPKKESGRPFQACPMPVIYFLDKIILQPSALSHKPYEHPSELPQLRHL